MYRLFQFVPDQGVGTWRYVGSASSLNQVEEVIATAARAGIIYDYLAW